MKPLHLAFVCDEFPPTLHGGTGSSYHDLARGLTARGHRVTVVGVNVTAPVSKLTTEQDGLLTVYRLPRAWALLGTRLGGLDERARIKRQLRRIHSSNPLSIIESSDYNGWLSLGGVTGIATVVRVRGANFFFDEELGRKKQVFEAEHEIAALRGASHLASVSAYAGRRTLELAGIGDRSFEVIHNAVDTNRFAPGEPDAVEAGLVVFVNTVCPRKGIEPLMAAMNRVFAEVPGTRLAVIGACPGGDSYLQMLTDKISTAHRGRVNFIGRLSRAETHQWVRKAAVCCYPSLMETFGIAVIESMSAGRPTIFSKYGPGPELIDHGRTGLLCDPHSIDDLASCLRRLLVNRDEAEAMGLAARECVSKRFDLPGWIIRNEEYYQSLLS